MYSAYLIKQITTVTDCGFFGGGGAKKYARITMQRNLNNLYDKCNLMSKKIKRMFLRVYFHSPAREDNRLIITVNSV